MQNIFDAVLGTHFAKAEKDAHSEDVKRMEGREDDADKIRDKADELFAKEMEGDIAGEYLFGGYFNNGDMTPEEVAMLNKALREDGGYTGARAFDILRKYVRRHARDVAEHKAN